MDISDMDYDNVTSSKSTRHYQVYRGMSPTTSNRLELRIKELEDNLELERDARMRAEKDLQEISFQFESLNERLEEADGLTSAQSEISKRREAELLKFKKEMELMVVQQESSEASLRKRHQEAINDMTDQIEYLTKNKNKAEKEKQSLIIEIDAVSTTLESANKARQAAENKADNMEDQLRRLKAQVDELTRNNQDLNNLKARLTQENFELQRQVQDLDSSSGTLAKARASLQMQIDDYKTRLEEESRERNTLSITVNNLQIELDNVNGRLEDECEGANQARAALSKAATELGALKTKYDKDMMMRTEELEDFRRRTNARIAELEDAAESAKNRASKFEKEKNRLMVEIREITVDLETANANLGDMARKLKQAEGLNNELQRRVDELTHDLQNATSDNNRLNAELTKLKVVVNDLTDRNDALSRENKNLSEALREAQGSNKDLNRQVQELTTIRVQLEGEREGLANELADTRDALKDAQARLDGATSALASLRAEMENRLREKDEELENIRRGGARALEELQRTLVEIETRYKSEMNKLKKKYEVEIREYELQVDTLGRSNAELLRSNKALGNKCKELEMALDDERRGGEEARQAVTVLERKRIALTTELEDIRSLLETSERARKNAENELGDAGSRVSELTISITALTNDKRRMEGDMSAMQADLDEAVNGRRAAEERADRFGNEVNRLMEELRQEQENYKNAESLRKQLEIEIREITVRLEEAEQFAQREGKRMVAKLQARLRDLEAEFETEQRRSREFAAANRKLERALAELRAQADEDHRVRIELQDQCNTMALRIRTLRRQLEEAEEVVTITMNKYRKGQQMLEEAEHRADMAEKTTVSRYSVRGGGRGRSMSVTREITRVVKV